MKNMHDDNYYFNVIRKNIKKYRKLRRLTQQQLADKCGLTMNYIAKIESDRMQRGFTISVLGRIADALEIDIRLLFDRTDTTQSIEKILETSR